MQQVDLYDRERETDSKT